MDLNDDGVITRQEFDVAALELQLRSQAPVGGGRYDSTNGNETWQSQSPTYGSVGTDRTASDFSGSGGSPYSPSVKIMYKRNVKTLEGEYTGPMLLDPAGALIKHGDNGTMRYSNGEPTAALQSLWMSLSNATFHPVGHFYIWGVRV